MPSRGGLGTRRYSAQRRSSGAKGAHLRCSPALPLLRARLGAGIQRLPKPPQKPHGQERGCESPSTLVFFLLPPRMSGGFGSCKQPQEPGHLLCRQRFAGIDRESEVSRQVMAAQHSCGPGCCCVFSPVWTMQLATLRLATFYLEHSRVRGSSGCHWPHQSTVDTSLHHHCLLKSPRRVRTVTKTILVKVGHPRCSFTQGSCSCQTFRYNAT